jgi:hypothetical protein
MPVYLENFMSVSKILTVVNILLGLLMSTSAMAESRMRFPLNPDPALTPGSLCTTGMKYRYFERIRYCTRGVATSLKQQVIATYDAARGFEIGKMDRREFKIDHYIPLCMGGSNEPNNLWPQHLTAFEHTDRIEQEICKRMSEGQLRQAEGVELIRRAKANLSESGEILSYVMSLEAPRAPKPDRL